MPSAFICSSSRRISGFSTATPNHHHRIMGLDSSGGCSNRVFSCAIAVCACSAGVANVPSRTPARQQENRSVLRAEIRWVMEWGNSSSFLSLFQKRQQVVVEVSGRKCRKRLSSRRRRRSGSQPHAAAIGAMLQTFAGPAGKRKLPSGKRPVSCTNTSMVLLSASRLFLQSVPKSDERSKVSKIEQTRCDRS